MARRPYNLAGIGMRRSGRGATNAGLLSGAHPLCGVSTPAPPEPDGEEHALNRRRAAIAVLPFVLLGVANVALLYGWGLRPLWAFVILPPILFISVIGWVAFRTGFVR